MEKIEFKTEEKVRLFDEIADKFYNRNFGQLSKSEFELMMFHFYIEKIIDANRYEDGTINYTKCSDYEISKELGITQQRVKNLKIKNQLTHPIEFDWKKSLAKITENARYDQITHKITLNIPDPNLYLEIQNAIESKGAYIEKQLNSRVLQLRVEYYIDLIIALEPSTNQKEIISDLKRFFARNGKRDNVFNDKEIGKSLINGAVNITEIVANITGMMSSENCLWKALVSLLKADLS